MLSNVGTSFFNGLLTATNGITATAGTTTLGVTLTSGFSNTGTLCNSGLISTNQLNAGSISNINLTFREPFTASTGTFRYSTLTTLLAIPNTSLLYFNDLVVGGAYVWPGQTIQALDWASGLNGTNSFNILAGQTFGYNTGTYSNIYVASNIFGGTPPYSFTDISAPDTLSNRGLSICNATGRLGVLTGTVVSMPPTSFTVLVSDSSTPKFVRNVNFLFTSNPTI
jgi:hypothetical protein